jgi:hypothetical protein
VNFSCTEEQQLLRDSIARFIQKEIAEIAAALNVRPIKKDKAA